MRNFGSDIVSQQQYLLAPPSIHHHLGQIKMEPYPLSKTKSHFSPVTILPHHNHYMSGHHNDNNLNINLSHSHLPQQSRESHLPSIIAACPANPQGQQRIPVNGSPYHSSHSPTLPVQNTALPTEIVGPQTPIPSNRSSPSNPIDSSAYSVNSLKDQHPKGKSPGPSQNQQGSIKSELAPASTGTNSPTTGNGPEGSGNQARIVSQNVNGTYAITGIPSNESELQLFRVFQRANLLSYFDMMIELGGDDVQQLCEAGKEEFLEIMSLIGMAQKPLHVRRLQKALQEWMTQPSLFQSPVLPPGYQPYGVGLDMISHTQSTTVQTTSVAASHHLMPIPLPHISQYPSQPTPVPSKEDRSSPSTSSYVPHVISSGHPYQGQVQERSSSPTGSTTSNSSTVSIGSHHHQLNQSPKENMPESSGSSGSESEQRDSPGPFRGMLIPSSQTDSPRTQQELGLQEHEIQKLAEAAQSICRSLQSTVKEPRLSKKMEISSYELIIRMGDDDPRRLDEIRKLSTIFGKNAVGDGKRKKVSVLELAMNEAAAQLCRLVPALLTKRDEMYNLARQVIKESGLPYSLICANLPEDKKGKLDERNSPAHEERISHGFAEACKKIKLDIRGVEIQEISYPKKISRETESGMHITEINLPRRKSPSRESNIVTATALKRMALVANEFRNSKPIRS